MVSGNENGSKALINLFISAKSSLFEILLFISDFQFFICLFIFFLNLLQPFMLNFISLYPKQNKMMKPNSSIRKKVKFGFTILGLFITHVTAWAQTTNVFDDIIAKSPDHTTLSKALIQEGLDNDLRNVSNSYTVFAPTDAAFTALATALNTDINGLLALPNLADVLKYHVLGSAVKSSQISNGQIVQPLSSSNTLKLTLTSTGSVFVNRAQVTTADVTAA
jgi:hypothetical protein